MSDRGLVLREFRPFKKNTLCGFATVELSIGLIMHDVAVHAKNGKVWASLPAAPQTENGAVRVVDGKTQYKRILDWRDREISDRFSEAVTKAVRAAHPRALE